MSSVRQEQRSLGELFGELSHETSTLVRQEIELATTELSEKASAFGKDAAAIAAGAVVLFLGVLTLVAAIVIGLGHVVGYGWSALIVGAILAGAGAFMAMGARTQMRSRSLALDKTTQTLKETRTWAREQMRS